MRQGLSERQSLSDRLRPTRTTPLSPAFCAGSWRGTTTQRITVAILDETQAEGAKDESDETFIIRLLPPVNGLWNGANEVVVRIIDNDVTIGWIQTSTSITEGDLGDDGTTITPRVSIQGISDRPATVSFESADGTATAGEDYVVADGTLTWNREQVDPQAVEVTIRRDRRAEPAEEQFTLTLTATSPNVVIDPERETLTVTINDDDEAGLIITEPDGGLILVEDGAMEIKYKIALTSRPTADVTIELNTAPAGKLQFKIGNSGWRTDSESIRFTDENWHTARTIHIRAREATKQDDGDDYVVIITHTATGAYPIDVPIEVSVTDNDTAALSLIKPPDAVDENTSATVNVKLDMPHVANVIVSYTLSWSDDYKDPSEGMLTFAASSTGEQSIIIPINCGAGGKELTITLHAPDPVVSLPDAHTITINDIECE